MRTRLISLFSVYVRVRARVSLSQMRKRLSGCVCVYNMTLHGDSSID